MGDLGFVAAMTMPWNIAIDFASLRRIKGYEYLSRFLLGGSITVATGLIASRWGPVVGGLFLAFPAIFPAGASLLDKHERDKKRNAGISHTIRGRLAVALDARGAAMGSIGLAVFALVAWRLLPQFNAAWALVAGFTAWFAVSAILWRVRKVHVYLTRKR
jgi:hypothetical protein